MEGRTQNPYASINSSDRETIEIRPAAYQQALANQLIQYARHKSLACNGPLVHARDILKRRVLKYEKLSSEVDSAKQRCPASDDAAIIGALGALGLSIGVAIPLSWGFIQEFEWSFLFSLVACVGLSLIDAAVSHIGGRLYSMLVWTSVARRSS
ncbi:MAG TPA: hypothetical protein VGL68_06330 [Solirubrobacteraceae bacterium]|jgi:hypothetical protein